MGRIVDDGFQSGLLGELPGAIVLRSQDHVPAPEHALLAGGYDDVQHMCQQRSSPIRREQLAAPEPPALAGGEDQSVSPHRWARTAVRAHAYPARSSAVSSARRVIT